MHTELSEKNDEWLENRGKKVSSVNSRGVCVKRNYEAYCVNFQGKLQEQLVVKS